MIEIYMDTYHPYNDIECQVVWHSSVDNMSENNRFIGKTVITTGKVGTVGNCTVECSVCRHLKFF